MTYTMALLAATHLKSESWREGQVRSGQRTTCTAGGSTGVDVQNFDNVVKPLDDNTDEQPSYCL